MPEILLIRLIKNASISIIMIFIGVISGIFSRSFYLSSIPILFGIIAAVATIKMYFDWKTGKLFVISAVCIHKRPGLIGKSSFVFSVIDSFSDKEFTFTLNNIKNSNLTVSCTYDFLFKNNKYELSEHSLIDYAVSNHAKGHLEEILSQQNKEVAD